MTNVAPIELVRFYELLDALAEVFAAEGRPGGDAAAAALRGARARPYRRRHSGSDPHHIVIAACSQSDALPIVEAVLACVGVVSWANWSGVGLSADTSRRIHFTELVGPDGHIEDMGVRVGLLASEAGVDYPISSHSGEETYLVISGTADWSVGDAPYAPQPPGSLIFHPAWAPHGRRTGIEPFLGAWRWSGDLDLSTFSVAHRD